MLELTTTNEVYPALKVPNSNTNYKKSVLRIQIRSDLKLFAGSWYVMTWQVGSRFVIIIKNPDPASQKKNNSN